MPPEELERYVKVTYQGSQVILDFPAVVRLLEDFLFHDDPEVTVTLQIVARTPEEFARLPLFTGWNPEGDHEFNR
jgi:hypothetical protein